MFPVSDSRANWPPSRKATHNVAVASSSRRSPRRVRVGALALTVAALVSTYAGVLGLRAAFVAPPRPGSSGDGGAAGRTRALQQALAATSTLRRGALPKEGTEEGSSGAEKAWAFFKEAYPVPAETGKYQNEPCDKATVIQRFESLCQIAGDEDWALVIAEKDPILLLRGAESVKKSWETLKSFELEGSSVTAKATVLKNPRLLTIPEFEYQRTKPSLESLDTAATAIDALRPFGQGYLCGDLRLLRRAAPGAEGCPLRRGRR